MNKQIGIFIVPTGIGASIGGYAGDASIIARKFAQNCTLIVNPNVVNAGGFSGITDSMLYLEGYLLDEFAKGNINLQPVVENNSIGIVFDKSIPQDVLNVHINTLNAVKMVYGVDIIGYEITDNPIEISFEVNNNGLSDGTVKNNQTLLNAARGLIDKGCNALAIVGMFADPESLNTDYSNGIGTDPVGGVEAVLSHYISKELCVPCAHSPAFIDYQISSEIVNPKSASEYITPTFLPCVLLGLSRAPSPVYHGGISINDVDFLVMPHNSLGSPAVFGALKHGVKVYSIKENSTALNITSDKLGIKEDIFEIETYNKCLIDLF